MSTNAVCSRYADRKIGLTIRLLEELAKEEDEPDNPMVLLEGRTEALRMLGELLIAMADEEEDCGMQIGPLGPGSVFFSQAAELGIYIHRLNDDGSCRDWPTVPQGTA
jgi:hypothetical protein